ncbi:MAG: pyridoxal-phosphate dependent enzyme, partial [Leptotrichiaceae bacterium]
MDMNSNFVEKQLEKLERIKKMYFNTPLIRLDVEYMKENYEVYSKYEPVQMTGSIKDRLAYYVFKRGYETGKIKEGTKIVEVSSGNTGIAMSALAAYLGHEITIVLPDWLSKERYKLLELYGAKLKLTTGENGFIDAVEIAKEYEKNGYFYPNQFACTENMQAHKETTAKEIHQQLNELGKSPEVFVAGVGSGGTCAGINEYVKENKLDTKVYLLEPFKSQSLTTKGVSNPRHMIQGIGDGFV